MGEALIDLILSSDGSYQPYLGGSPYNVAIGLARQGVKVSYLSSLSDDTFGDQLYQQLHEEGVHVALKRRSRYPTSLAMITLDSQGQPDYRLYREGIADKDTTYEDVIENIPSDLQVFHTGSLALTPSQLPKIHKVFDFMHKRDVLVSIDINIRLGASVDTPKYLAGVRSLLSSADIVKASDEDVDALGIDSDVGRSAELMYREMGGGVLILTKGGEGVTIFSQHGLLHQPAHPVPMLADTVGAGDTFHAAFLASLSRSGSLSGSVSSIGSDALSDAAEFAGVAAAINVAKVGCCPPSYEEVLKVLEDSGAAEFE